MDDPRALPFLPTLSSLTGPHPGSEAGDSRREGAKATQDSLPSPGFLGGASPLPSPPLLEGNWRPCLHNQAVPEPGSYPCTMGPLGGTALPAPACFIGPPSTASPSLPARP